MKALKTKRTIARQADAPRFDLPGPLAKTVAPGVTQEERADGTTVWRFQWEKPGSSRSDEVSFAGTAGMLEAGPEKKRILIATGAATATVAGFSVEGEGPFEMTVSESEVQGRSAGPMRLFVTSVPAGLYGLPDLWVDGVRWCPGNLDRAGSGWYVGNDVPRQMGIAVPAGAHTFAVKPFAYPPAWRELEW